MSFQLQWYYFPFLNTNVPSGISQISKYLTDPRIIQYIVMSRSTHILSCKFGTIFLLHYVHIHIYKHAIQVTFSHLVITIVIWPDIFPSEQDTRVIWLYQSAYIHLYRCNILQWQNHFINVACHTEYVPYKKRMSDIVPLWFCCILNLFIVLPLL